MFNNLDFCQHYWKSFFCSNLQKSRLWYKFSKMLGTNVWKSGYWWKFSTNLVWPKFWKSRICKKISEILSYFCLFLIISNLVKIMVNLDFFKLSKNQDFSEILWKISSLFEFPGKYRLWIIFVSKNLDVSQSFRNCWFLSKLWKTSILVKIFENLNFSQGIKNFDFCRKILKITILVKFLKNLALCSNFWKISNLVNIFGKSRFFCEILKNLDFPQNFWKSRFC